MSDVDWGGLCTLYEEIRRLAPDFVVYVEVWSRGRQVTWRASIGDKLFVGSRALPFGEVLYADLLVFTDTLLRAQKILSEARGIRID